jgi:TolA-binding protein
LPSGSFTYLNYKLADYTALRQENWQKFSLDDVGVSAQFKNEEERNKYYNEHPEQRIDYVDYVSQCVKAYDENKFALAIDRFAEILKQYPDDVNALFYTGMSHYKLGSYSTAEDLFSKVEKNFIRTFNEEALFYHGKSLKKLNRIDEANALFVKVVKWNGFYKEQAIEEMQSNE